MIRLQVMRHYRRSWIYYFFFTTVFGVMKSTCKTGARVNSICHLLFKQSFPMILDHVLKLMKSITMHKLRSYLAFCLNLPIQHSLRAGKRLFHFFENSLTNCYLKVNIFILYSICCDNAKCNVINWIVVH